MGIKGGTGVPIEGGSRVGRGLVMGVDDGFKGGMRGS